MEWKNGSELDLTTYSLELCYIIEGAVEHCAENSFGGMTTLALLYPLFISHEGRPEFKSLTSDSQKALAQVVSLVKRFLKTGISFETCRRTIDTSASKTNKDINPFERDYWDNDPAMAVEESEGCTLTRFLMTLLSHAAERASFENELLQDLLDLPGLLKQLPALESAVTVSMFDNSGAINKEALSLSAGLLLEAAAKAALENGCQQLLLVHILYALLEDRDGYAMQTLRQTTLSIGESSVMRHKLKALFPSGNALLTSQPLVNISLSEPVLAMLNASAEETAKEGDSLVDDRMLFLQLLLCNDTGTRNVIENILNLNIKEILPVVESSRWDPLFIRLPLELCDCENISLSQARPLVERLQLTEDIIKALYRKDCHNVALFGERGVGKTTVARLLAHALKKGEAPSLKITPVIYFDAASIPEEELSSRIPRMFTHMEEHPRPIYVWDNFGIILNAAPKLCARRLNGNPYKLVAIIDVDAKNALDRQENAGAFFRFVEVTEPRGNEAKEIIAAQLPIVSAEYGVSFSPGANLEGFALRLASDYILSKRLPKKAIDLLANAAADAAAEVALKGGAKPEIGRRQLAEQIAAETGLPAETILGTGQDKDYSYLLSKSLVGQDNAVLKVADRLDLIQKGFVDKRRPAAIFLFAGLSGTGKTELAKQIASVYSSSHKIITYPMASFTEPQTVSGIIGSAPGLVGFEQGGKLINDINKDPYSLILFDEVEKADPSIWDPFLNLFDEGVITDMRGVSAYANKAFFVMTSNIGQYEIVRMLRDNRPLEEIENTIKDLVGEARHFRSNEKCFRPEFIGRIMRSGGIVIFNALSLDAMEGITRHMANKSIAEYAEMRECKLEIDDDVIQTIAKIAYEENEVVLKSGQGQYLGGRRLDTLFDAMVYGKLAAQMRQMANALMVRIVMDGQKTALIPITDESEIDTLLKRRRATTIDRVAERLARISTFEPDALHTLSDDKLARMDAILAEAGIMAGV